jgi:sirohydrochlorin ferrochelatase
VTPPALVAVAHGTADPAGARVVEALLDVVRSMRPDLTVLAAYLEHAEPTLPDALAQVPPGAVVVPLLLSTGFHVRHDIPALAHTATVARHLGPSRLLAEALRDRLADSRPPPRSRVVLAAAGSADADGIAEVEVQARQLGHDVRPGYLSASPRVDEVVAVGPRPVAVATYLLTPSRFLDQLAACGADTVAAPLGAHPAVARLVLRRYAEA